jgi:phage shock protein PspC (stress-responsive transcriptional regulator)
MRPSVPLAGMERLGDLTDDDPAPVGAPAPAAPPERPGRVIGGVAGTLAERLGVDALWVRLGFVVLGLAGGIGVVVYAAWWLILSGGPNARVMRIAGGALLVAVVPWLVADGPQSFVTGPFAVILLLAGLALALWQPRREQAPLAPPAGAFPPPAPPTTPTAPTAAQDELDGPWQLLADGLRPPEQTPARRRFGLRWPRRERSMLGRLTLFVAVYLGAAWALADQLDGGRLHPEQWFGAAAVVCGAGMVVGMFLGRARWLIVPALLAAGAGYVGGTMARLGITSGDLAGDRYVSVGSYSTDTELDERVGVGQIRIDIDSPPPPQPVHIDARVGLGQIRLYVPDDVTVELRPRVDHGSVTSSSGLTLSESAPIRIGDGATPDVVVDARVGRGDIDVVIFETGPYLAEVPPVATAPLMPPDAGSLVPIRDGVAMTTDGWVVLGDGDAIISPDDEVTSLQSATYPEPDGTQQIETGWGSFRLLPRSLLLTPDGQVLDLQALRAEVATAAEPPPGTTTTAPPATGDPTVPVTTVPGG